MAPNGGQCSTGEQHCHERLDHGRAGGEEEDRVEGQHGHGQPPLPGVGRDPVDACECGQPKHRAEDLERSELVPSENGQDGGAEHVVSGQPCVLHPEERVVQVSGLGQVGGDEPVPVAVLEWFRQLRREQEENPAQTKQSGDRGQGTNARQGTSAQAAQGHHLDEIGRAESGHRDKPEAEHA